MHYQNKPGGYILTMKGETYLNHKPVIIDIDINLDKIDKFIDIN